VQCQMLLFCEFACCLDYNSVSEFVCLFVCPDLERKLREVASCRMRLIATDGVFSMDGNVAPLRLPCVLPPSSTDSFHTFLL